MYPIYKEIDGSHARMNTYFAIIKLSIHNRIKNKLLIYVQITIKYQSKIFETETEISFKAPNNTMRPGALKG